MRFVVFCCGVLQGVFVVVNIWMHIYDIKSISVTIINIHIHIYIHTHTHIYIYTHIYTYIYICTYICMCAWEYLWICKLRHITREITFHGTIICKHDHDVFIMTLYIELLFSVVINFAQIMVISKSDKQVRIFNGKPCAPFQCWEIIGNQNISLCFLNIVHNLKG